MPDVVASSRGAAGPVVVFAGGGTGGHLYPSLALAESLGRIRPDMRAVFLGAERGVEARVLPDRGLPHRLFRVRGLDRSRLLANVGVAFDLARATSQARRWYREIEPALVTVTGGYAAGPGAAAAVMGRIPIVLQEQNSRPGITTRILSRWARQIHLAFPEAEGQLARGRRAKVYDSGNPIREFEPLAKPEARRRLGLPESGSLVYVVGGSQGSKALNDLFVGAVGAIGRGELERPGHLQLLWVAGPTHEASVRDALDEGGARAPWVHLRGYMDDVEAALGAADLAVSRAGAMTTSEYLAAGMPAILVPLPTSAEDHQAHNARALEAAGAALHLPQGDLTPERLWDTILGLTENVDRLVDMAACARRRARPHAAREIAARMAELLPPMEARA